VVDDAASIDVIHLAATITRRQTFAPSSLRLIKAIFRPYHGGDAGEEVEGDGGSGHAGDADEAGGGRQHGDRTGAGRPGGSLRPTTRTDVGA